MVNPLTSAALVAVSIATVIADGSPVQINGNYYGNPVKSITYSNFGAPGTYNRITHMGNGQCSSEPFAFQGGMSPLDGEISWHFRGPMHLKQFAYYALGSDTAKRDLKTTPHQRRHGHSRFHKRDTDVVEVEEKRGVGDWITATINGQVVSWANNYGGQPTSATQPSIQTGYHEASPNPIVPATSSSTYDTPSPSNEPMPYVNVGSGNWGRQAYYNAEKGEANGLVFLNNHGGAGSGIFDYTWGASLSYASDDASTGSASPQILKDQFLPDNNEFSIFTDKKCQNNSCGFVRPDTVAYHGFDGSSKLFLFEFDMPLTGKTGFNMDMPAIWALNAQIPRTIQYGPAECSCWTSGCGEWDIFEILDSGNTRCKSTFHGVRSGGESDYFERPTTGTMKAAVIFDGSEGAGHIVVLPDDTTFDLSISGSIVDGFAESARNGNSGSGTIFILPN